MGDGRQFRFAKQLASFPNWFVLLVFVLAVALLFSTYNYSGLCFAKGGWLSNGEIQQAVFDEYNRPIGSPGKGDKWSEPYASLDDLLRTQPNCCSNVIEQLRRPSIVVRLLGLASYTPGRIQFVTRYRHKDGSLELSSNGNEMELSLTACGMPTYLEN